MPGMPRLCPICGPKMSLFCMVISGWGILFLGLLGIFFYLESGILIEDLTLDEQHFDTKAEFMGQVHEDYRSNAVNCWIASALYVVTLIGAFWQNKWNPSGAAAATA